MLNILILIILFCVGDIGIIGSFKLSLVIIHTSSCFDVMMDLTTGG